MADSSSSWTELMQVTVERIAEKPVEWNERVVVGRRMVLTVSLLITLSNPNRLEGCIYPINMNVSISVEPCYQQFA